MKSKNMSPKYQFCFKKTMEHYAGQLIRYISSSLHRKDYFTSVRFPEGISFLIVTKNDIWLTESLKSIVKYADEVVIVDSSDQPYLKRNIKLLSDLKIKNYKHIIRDLDLPTARAIGLSECSYKWIFIWDGDHIAMDNGKFSFEKLINYVRNLDTTRYYYAIHFHLATMGYQLDEIQPERCKYAGEAWIISNSDHFKFDPRKKWDEPVIPFYYRKIFLQGYYALHLNVIRPITMHQFRDLRISWYNERKKKDISFQDYIKTHKEIGSEPWHIRKAKYDESYYGLIPTLLNKYKGLSYEQIIEEKEKEIEEYIK